MLSVLWGHCWHPSSSGLFLRWSVWPVQDWVGMGGGPAVASHKPLLYLEPAASWHVVHISLGSFSGTYVADSYPFKSHATFPGKPCYLSEDGACAQRALWSASSLSGKSYLTYHLFCWYLFPPLGCNQHEGRCLVHHKWEQWYLRCNRHLVRK